MALSFSFVFYFLILNFLLIGEGFSMSPEMGELIRVREKAADWLMSQMNENSSWGHETPKVLIALAATGRNISYLTAKQHEIEILSNLLSFEKKEHIKGSTLAQFAVSIYAICRNPHDFYGNNIIDTLEKIEMEHLDEDTFEFTQISLATCLSGKHMSKRHNKHLVKILRNEPKLYSIESRAVAILALKCIERKRSSAELNRIIHEGMEKLGSLQKQDGTFGNTFSTSLAIQALGVEADSLTYWNESSGIRALLSSQSESGSFSANLSETAESILALTTLLNVPTLLMISPPLSCSLSQNTLELNRSKNTALVSSHVEAENKVDEESVIEVKYYLWIGPNPLTALKLNLTLQIPPNSTFFHCMQKAAEQNSAFKFSSTIWPNGHYIHTISGQREQPVLTYWLLYRLTEDPDPANPPQTNSVAEKGVDELIVHNGESYLFWLKKV